MSEAVENFYGTVSLVDWFSANDGENYKCLTGVVSILEASKVVGFAVKHDPTANWMARIDGPTQSIYIPGCKVMGVTAHERNAISRTSILVVP